MLRTLSLACLVIAVSFGAQSRPFQHPFGELREYHRHWLAVCPNEHQPGTDSDYYTSCWASAWTGNPDGTFGGDFPGDRLSVLRNRSTGAIKITFVSDMVENIDTDRPIEVRYSSGRIRDYTFGSDVTTNGNSLNEYIFTDPGQVEDIIARMRRGSHVVITLPTKTGERRMQFSTLGLRAAMGFLERYAN
ncbi:MAG: hypothetical protein AAGA88_08985 [Pseudomonadota bacterium]